MPLVLLLLSLWTQIASAQNPRGRTAALPRDRFTSGTATLRAFAPVAEAARESVVNLELDGKTVALGAIIDRNGLVITKASELNPALLSVDDIKDLSAFVAKLTQQSVPMSQFLWNRFSGMTRREMSAYAETSAGDDRLGHSVVEELNRIFQDGSIYQTERFAKMTMSAETESLLQSNPKDDEVIRLNRLLLSDAFPSEIAKIRELKDCKLTCRLAEGKTASAELAAIDKDNDVALVKISATGLKPVEWAPEDATVGQWVVTPGLETTPEAVGIISVPARKLHRRALIGVEFNFNATQAKITRVMAGFGAEKAGIKPGDVILAVNGAPVNDNEDLRYALRNFREGETVKLRVQREEKEFDTDVQMMPEQKALPQQGGRGFFNRAERMNRMGGRLSQRAEDFELAIQHDTVLQPWQCGGPLVNLDGKAIGLNIARAGRAASYALPAALVKQMIQAWVSP